MERDFSVEESPEWFWLHTRLLNTVGSLSETYIPPHQELYYQRTSSSANRTVVSVVRKTSSFDTGYKNRGLLYFNVELSDFVSLTDSLNCTLTWRPSYSRTRGVSSMILPEHHRTDRQYRASQRMYIRAAHHPRREKVYGSTCHYEGSRMEYLFADPMVRIHRGYPWLHRIQSDIGHARIHCRFYHDMDHVRRISAPAEELSRTMKSVRSGNIRQHASVISSDEIGELSATFNTMLDRINLLIEQEYQLKVKQQDAQMKALQAQINPHFLYNILQSIASIASLNHLPEISVMANSLGKMMRYSIKTEENTTTLDDELIHVAHYLEIQKIRFKNQLDYSIDSCEAYGRYPLLKLTLQPLVENAVMHGFTGDHQKLFIYIHVYQEGIIW